MYASGDYAAEELVWLLGLHRASVYRYLGNRPEGVDMDG